MKHRAGVFAAAIVTVSSGTAFAGGWTQDRGDYYAKLWGTTLFGDAAFGLDGASLPTDDFFLLSVSAYGEYGLFNDLTLVGFATPVGTAKLGASSIAHTGKLLGGVRYRFVDQTIQVAVEARLGGAPGLGDTDLAPPDAGYVFVPTSRTLQTELDLQLGFPLPFGWVAASVGPRAFSNAELSHAIGGSLQVGGQFGQFVVDLHSTLNWTFQALEVVNVTGATDTRYVGVGLGVSWWPAKRFGVHLGGDGALYAASNAEALAIQLGVESR